jgi:hypothetical protein
MILPEMTAVKPEAKKVNAVPAQTRVDQARIAKWIRDRLMASSPGLCWHCRRPFVFGQKFIDLRGAETTVRFHVTCHTEWLARQEAAARRALGLERATKESPAP